MSDVFGPDEPFLWRPSEEPFLPEPEEGYPSWFGQEITVYDANAQEIGSMSKEEWFGELLRTKEELVADYGMDNISIIYALEDAGLWSAEDWEEWRAYYEAIYGSR